MARMIRWTRGLLALLLATALAACGAPLPGQLADPARATLVVVPSLDRGYGPLSIFDPYTRQTVQHLVLRLAKLAGDPENPTEQPVLDPAGQPVQVDLPAADLGRAVSFVQLRTNTRYRVRAFAYQGPGVAEADLISTLDASSYVDVDVASDDQPAMAQLRVRLRDRNVYVGPTGESRGLPEGQGQGASDESAPQAVYNSVRAEWLLVWQDDRQGYPALFARRLSRAGAVLGQDIRIAEGAGDSPSVAYDPAADAYLIVWKAERGATGYDVVGRRLGGSGSLLGGEIVVSASANVEQYQPCVAYNPTAGEFLVIWYEFRGASGFDVMGRRLASDGSPTGGDLVISASAGLEQYRPRLTFNPTWNEYLVVWYEYRGGVSWDIMGKRLGPGGASIGSDFVVSNGSNQQEQPTVIANPGAAECLVVWQENRGATGYDIVGRRVGAAGTLVGSDLVVSASVNAQFQPAIALDPLTGVYHVAWAEATASNGFDVLSRRVGGTGSLVGAETVVSSRSGHQTEPTLAIDTGNGQALAAWNEGTATGRDLYFSLIGVGAGQALGAPTRVYAEQSGARLTRNPTAGTYLLTWLEDRAIQAQAVDDAGQPIGAVQVVSSTPGAKAALAVAFNAQAGEFLLVWQEYRGNQAWDVVGRRVGPTGQGIGGEFLIGASSQPQELPAVAYDATANAYLVVWQELQGNLGTDVVGRRVSGAGTPIGNAFAVSATANPQEQAAIAYNAATDDYLVVWSEHRGATGYDIVGKRVRADGSLLGSDFVLSANAGYQEQPGLVLNAADGEYLVAWQEHRGATGYDVLARRVSTLGGLVGSEVVLSSTANPQEQPTLAFNPRTREYLVAWQESRAGTGWDILARRVAATGGLIGAELVLSGATLDQLGPRLAYNPTANDFLVAWTDGRHAPAGRNFDVFLQLVDSFAGR